MAYLAQCSLGGFLLLRYKITNQLPALAIKPTNKGNGASHLLASAFIEGTDGAVKLLDGRSHGEDSLRRLGW